MLESNSYRGYCRLSSIYPVLGLTLGNTQHTHACLQHKKTHKASTNMHNKQALSPIDELPIPVNTKGLEAVTSSELE